MNSERKWFVGVILSCLLLLAACTSRPEPDAQVYHPAMQSDEYGLGRLLGELTWCGSTSDVIMIQKRDTWIPLWTHHKGLDESAPLEIPGEPGVRIVPCDFLVRNQGKNFRPDFDVFVGRAQTLILVHWLPVSSRSDLPAYWSDTDWYPAAFLMRLPAKINSSTQLYLPRDMRPWILAGSEHAKLPVNREELAALVPSLIRGLVTEAENSTVESERDQGQKE